MYASFSRGSSHMMNPTFDCTSSLIRSPSSNRLMGVKVVEEEDGGFLELFKVLKVLIATLI